MAAVPGKNSRLIPLGAARTVTGSKFLIEHHGTRLLVDCGIYQGGRELRERNWEPFHVDAGSIDAVIITHAHLDHSGYLPRLMKEGFHGPVFATRDTAKLMAVVLPDSGRLQEEEAHHANKYGYSRHDTALPLYTEEDAWSALELVRSIDFREEFIPIPGMKALFSPSGHILGSSILRLQLEDGPRVTFSGDLGRPSHPLLVPPGPAGDCDYLLVESTYGDREHVDGHTPEMLADLIRRTTARGGVTVIPAFAVDRTEVLLYHMHKMVLAGELPRIPIYVDSPMALAALKIYYDAFEEFAEDVRPELHDAGELFDLPGLEQIQDAEGSKALAKLQEPAVIIAGAGMASGGRVVHHLKRFLPDPRNSVALVGFQAMGTRGRQLLEGVTNLKIHGQYVHVKAEICNLTGFSVHADASELVDWVGTATGDPTVFVIHGEEDAALALCKKIEDNYGFIVAAPEYKEHLLLSKP